MIMIHIFGQNQNIVLQNLQWKLENPLMVNPSSYEALLEVMDHVKKTCSFESDKECIWIVLASDEVPYVLAYEMHDNLKQCCSYSLEINTNYISKGKFRVFTESQKRI